MDTDTITRQPRDTYQAARDRDILRRARFYGWVTGLCQSLGCDELGVLVEDERGHEHYACPEDQGVDTNPVTAD